MHTTFSVALDALKSGKSVQRAGWNGAGLQVKMSFPSASTAMTLPFLYIEYPENAKTTPSAKCP